MLTDIETHCTLAGKGRTMCVHTEWPANPEGWWSALGCTNAPLRGEPYCLAHRPPGYVARWKPPAKAA